MLELLTSEEQCQKFLTALRKLDNNTLSTTSEKMEILEPSLMTIGHWMTLGCTSAQSSWGLLRKVANNTSLTSSHKMEILEPSLVTIGHWMKLGCVHWLSMAFSYYTMLTLTMPSSLNLLMLAASRGLRGKTLSRKSCGQECGLGCCEWHWLRMTSKFTETKLRHCWNVIKFFRISIQAYNEKWSKWLYVVSTTVLKLHAV